MGIRISLDPVKLIQPVRIPARHTHVMKAELECRTMDRDTLMLVKSPTTEVVEPKDAFEISTPQGYLEEFSQRMPDAWNRAKEALQKTQQKQQHYKRGEATSFCEGDVAFIFMPAGAERKLQCPDDGPYHITRLWSTGAEVTRLVHKKKTIHVALERLRCCPPELLKAAGLSSPEDDVAGLEDSMTTPNS